MKRHILLFLLLIPWHCKAESFEARIVRVIDGDTIVVLKEGQEIRIRLAGIDCPEMSQPYGIEAKQFVEKSVPKMGRLRVDVQTKDRYGRLVAIIWLQSENVGAVRERPAGKGLAVPQTTIRSLSLNERLVQAGLAWWYRQYSQDKLLAVLESKAKVAYLGLWAQSSPRSPWEFRKINR